MAERAARGEEEERREDAGRASLDKPERRSTMMKIDYWAKKEDEVSNGCRLRV